MFLLYFLICCIRQCSFFSPHFSFIGFNHLIRLIIFFPNQFLLFSFFYFIPLSKLLLPPLFLAAPASISHCSRLLQMPRLLGGPDRFPVESFASARVATYQSVLRKKSRARVSNLRPLVPWEGLNRRIIPLDHDAPHFDDV